MAGSGRRLAVRCTVCWAQLPDPRFSDCEWHWGCCYLCSLPGCASSRDQHPAGEGGLRLWAEGGLSELTLRHWQWGTGNYTSGWEKMSGKDKPMERRSLSSCWTALWAVGRSGRPGLNLLLEIETASFLYCQLMACQEQREGAFEPSAEEEGRKRMQRARYQEGRKLIYGGEVMLC